MNIIDRVISINNILMNSSPISCWISILEKDVTSEIVINSTMLNMKNAKTGTKNLMRKCPLKKIKEYMM